MRLRLRSRLLAAIVLVVGWAISACGGGGGGSPTQPPSPSPSAITFTPDAQAGANSVYLAAGQGGSATRLILDVRVNDVSDLYGVSFELEFPDRLLDFRPGGTSEGTLLSEGGQVDTELLVENVSPGTLVIGHSRLGVVPGAEGSGTLFSLAFNSLASGTGSISLRDHDALDSLGEAQDDTTWIGGSVRVQVN